MDKVLLKLREWDSHMILWLKGHVMTLVQLSIGIVYLIFGGLKFIPDYSPAQDLGVDTVVFLTSGLFSPNTALILLAILEVVIGLGLILSFRLKWTVRIALAHMACTFLPLIFLPDYTFTNTPFSLSLVGQYILKNLIIVSALLAIYSDFGKNQQS